MLQEQMDERRLRKLAEVNREIRANELVRDALRRGVSRQRLWQIKQAALGNCIKCGAKRPAELSIMCRRCADVKNARDLPKQRNRQREGRQEPAA